MVGALVTVLAVSACTADPPRGPGAPAAPRPQASAADTVASGLGVPWSVAFHRGVPLVSERDSARILELDGAGGARVVGTVEGVTAVGEGGLLGIATHQGELYAYSTSAEGNRIQRFPLVGDPGALRLGPPRTILADLPSASYHNGGRIAFGPDGMLYATVGDAGDRDSAQDLGALSGKILRLTPDGGVPADNPFPGSPVYSYGHRNPQGLAWADDGTLFASEFGQNTWDELNVIEPGANYGWPLVEGIAGRPGHVDPVQQWDPADASPSGIAIHRGRILVANLRGERLFAVPVSAPATSVELHTGTYGRLRDVVVAPDGTPWIVTSNTDGRGDPSAGDDRVVRIPSP
ncbi:PQQ-dependent sugar dehydrogenase [Pseudonocardia sp. C8]|uniref:PQQ-dependent sugar dehydrogenase n=1 Tax=Pseudonocardia sp. C8 TaxID=2762759 RepID=UPI001642CF67|nr:PQQ-dependent sugar dehydrogenase [Pseudonocardia sp. C8]